MTGDNYNPWPHEAVEELKLLWDQGYSASIIGGRMKKTRNAVIGKVTRLKLPKRASSVKMAKIQARHIRPPKVGHRQTNYNFAFGKVAKERKPPMLEVHVIPALEEIVPVNGTGITILDLHKEVCHAVVSMPDRRSNELARYCGHEVYDGRYCEGHYVAFHMPLRPAIGEIMELKSDFAILDVKAGRGPLNKHFAKRPKLGECPPAMRVPVTITGYIDDVWGGDDGVSREFGVTVQSVKVKKR